MPYRIDSRNGQYCVVKKEGGATVKCHADRSAAVRHLVALEAATADERAFSPGSLPMSAETIRPSEAGPARRLKILGAPYYGPEGGRDSNSTYFSPKTNFLLDYPPLLPTIWYNHGTVFDTTNREPLGVASSRWVDDSGVWFQFDLDRDNPLHIQLWEEALTGNLYASSGAIPASRVVEADGHISQWHIGEVSILPLVKETGQRPVNMYAVALPQILSTINALQDGDFERLETLYAKKEGLMSWLDELRSRLGGVLDVLDRVPAEMSGCPDCPPKPAPMPMPSSPPVLSATNAPVVDPRVAQLEAQVQALSAKQAQAEDGAWINAVLATGQLQQTEVTHVMGLLTQARVSSPALVDNIRSMIGARPVVAAHASGVMGFAAPQRQENGGIVTEPTDEYMSNLRRMFNKDDGMEVK